jgi:hypothetical protein
MIVERCACTSSSNCGYIAGQIDLRVASLPPGVGSSGSSGALCSGSTIDSTGTWILTSSGLRTPASTIRQVREGPTMKRPTSSSGFCVADSPIRCGSRPCSSITSALSRSSVSAMCAPRLVEATAWISSTITDSTSRSTSRAPDVNMRYNDSGVVISTSGGVRRICARSFCGVSPVRIPTLSAAPIPISGACRLRSTS